MRRVGDKDDGGDDDDDASVSISFQTGVYSDSLRGKEERIYKVKCF